ncbi:MAG: DUF1573 domain-containing protein [candidate division Zixibacteria bacterium]|jgi:hypothetical protein|nr:DUF1573 domain-containing protein [candidate division Zixibacteria bacterium]
MKRILISIAILWLASISNLLAAPKIQVDRKDWDFGQVCRNATIRHAYVIKNVGDSTLTIKRVKAG